LHEVLYPVGCLSNSIRAQVLSLHALGGVQSNEDVQSFALHFFQPIAPLGSGQSEQDTRESQQAKEATASSRSWIERGTHDGPALGVSEGLFRTRLGPDDQVHDQSVDRNQP